MKTVVVLSHHLDLGFTENITSPRFPFLPLVHIYNLSSMSLVPFPHPPTPLLPPSIFSIFFYFSLFPRFILNYSFTLSPSSLSHTHFLSVTYLELCKVYLRLDQPNSALAVYEHAHQKFNYGDTQILVSMARLHDMLNHAPRAMRLYKQVLLNDAANIESMACLAAFYFYSDQQEVGLRFYRRMVQMGAQSPELWNNLGLCCFYSSQYVFQCLSFSLLLSTNRGTFHFFHPNTPPLNPFLQLTPLPSVTL